MVTRIVIKYPLHTELLCIEKVLYLEAAGSSTYLYYVCAHNMASTKQSGNIGKYEEHLPAYFHRIRDNIIINLRYVKHFTTDRTIFLNSPDTLSFVVPKKRWPEVKERLSGQLVISF